jgi:TorA maturation chaperone TorD
MMDKKTRSYIYAFLSRVFSYEVDADFLKDIKSNEDVLKLVGIDSYNYLKNTKKSNVLEELNIDFHSLFNMNNHPYESAILDSKNEIMTGLQNPVMQFYLNHGYDINLEYSPISIPDHIAVELGFMQKLVLLDKPDVQKEFLNLHLLQWVPPFMIGIKPMAQTPLYKDLCDFTVDFLFNDFDGLTNG